MAVNNETKEFFNTLMASSAQFMKQKLAAVPFSADPAVQARLASDLDGRANLVAPLVAQLYGKSVPEAKSHIMKMLKFMAGTAGVRQLQVACDQLQVDACTIEELVDQLD